MTKEIAERMSTWNLRCEIKYRVEVKKTDTYKNWSRSEKNMWSRSITTMSKVVAERMINEIFEEMNK